MKVSVIIPTYNSERTMKRALLSVINQDGLHSEFDLEILICDDGSTDGTLEICDNFSKRIHNLTILKNPVHTGGPNAGRNAGIRHATGDVLCFLDHDDQWLRSKVKTQLKEIANGADLTYSPCIKVKE